MAGHPKKGRPNQPHAQQHFRRSSDASSSASAAASQGASSSHERQATSSPGLFDSQSKRGAFVPTNEFDEDLPVSGLAAWGDILFVPVGIGALVVLSILVGITAGMIISIHHYEINIRPIHAASKLDPLDPTAIFFMNRPGSYRRVTMLDPTIASRNFVQRGGHNGLDLGKVITTNKYGQLDLLMIVEEASPLHHSIATTSSDTTKNTKSSATTTTNGNGSVGSHHHDKSSSRKQNSKTNASKHKSSPSYNMYETPGATQSVPFIEIRESSVHPVQCPTDPRTIGFDSWTALKAAVQEANTMSAERFMKWNEYFAAKSSAAAAPAPSTATTTTTPTTTTTATINDESARAVKSPSFTTFQDDALYYEDDVYITICPNVALKARRGPIFINAENILIECDGCVIDVGGTHFAFGPHAKNIIVRGLTFRNAHSSSQTFFHDGAEASYEDCRWESNSGITAKYGTVADVNSTSTVNFYRCEIGHGRNGNVGANAGFASSLSIRA